MPKRLIPEKRVPPDLMSADRWVVRRGKLPCDIETGKVSDATSSATWVSFQKAHDAYRTDGYDGVGFAFSDCDDILAIDLDGAIESGHPKDWANQILEHFPDTYVELSPSRKGFHIIARGEVPGDRKRGRKGVEIYEKERYFTFTGDIVNGHPLKVTNCQEAINWLYSETFEQNGKPKAPKVVSRPDAEIPKDRLEKLFAEFPRARRVFDGEMAYATPSEADQAIANYGSYAGWSRQEVADLIQRARQERKNEPARKSQVQATVASAFEDEVIANCHEEKKGKQTIVIPTKMRDIIVNAKELTGDWPRRVDDALFVDSGGDIAFIKSESHLFGFYHRKVGRVLWRAGKRLVTKRELFAELQRTATAYEAIEQLPHEPRFTTHYYACAEVTAGKGDHLRRLLDKFTPATDVDRDLIQASLMTPAWGGPPGRRPAFVITSEHGRGVGKTTLAEMAALLWGGILSFSHREEIGKIKTRLLTPEALTRRVCLLDNVKSLKFSWAELEGTITATTIGGHRMYVGEGTRPNTLTWFVTLNGASLSTDMSQRSVVIHLGRPKRSGKWADETQQFIVDNQQRIIADIIGILRQKAPTLDRYSRWATWERDVLARLPKPPDAQRVIEERQVGVDVEAEEAATIEEHFASKLRREGYSPDKQWVFIPSRVANEWYCEAQNDRVTTSASTRMLKQLATEGRLKRLRENRRGDLGRGFLWTTEGPSRPIATDLELRLRQ